MRTGRGRKKAVSSVTTRQALLVIGGFGGLFLIFLLLLWALGYLPFEMD
jgi:hypothetical protein